MDKQIQFRVSILTIIIFIASAVFVNLSAQILPGQAPDFLWARSAGGNGYDGATDLTVDINGDIVVVGYFDSTATFGSSILQSAGSSDIFVAKYSNSGSVIWAVRAGGANYDQALSVTTDNLNNIIVTGIFSGTATFETTTLNSFGSYDIFTAKYNSNGALQWVQQGGGQSYDYGSEVTTDNLNNIIVTGTFQQFATFGTFTVQSGNPYGDIYVVKYNSSGVAQWVQAAFDQSGGQSFYNLSYGVATDPNNNVFITGSFSNIITFGDSTLVSSFDGTNEDIFLAKYDALGNFNWVAQVGSDSSGAYSYGNDIKIDKQNNIIFTGRFQVQANFGLITLNGTEYSDIFIAKYNQSGNPIWAVQDHESIFDNQGKELDLDDAGNISLIGNVSLDIELNNVYFARYTNTGEKLWGMTTGILNPADAGGLAIDSNGDIYGCGDFYSSGQFGTITLNGVNSEAFVGKIPSPKFTISPDPVNFDSIPTLSVDSIAVTLTNTSGANLHVFSVALLNDTSGSFGILSGLPLDSIVALQSANLTIGFLPVYTGFKNAFFEITSDASTSPDTIFVSGTGIVPNLYLSDSLINFGSIDLGLFSDYSLVISNLSIADILLDSTAIGGMDASDFTVTTPVNGDTVHPFGVQILNIRFQPDTSGLKNAYLVIYSGAGSSPDTVQLIGTGLSSIQVQVPSAPSIGQPTPLNISPPSPTLYITKDIYYRRTGELLYQQDTLTTVGNNYSFDIPAEYSTISGIQYYILFSDGLNIVTYPTLNPDTNPASIQVSVSSMDFPNPIAAAEYQMFSIPLSINSPQIDSVFDDDYGPYDIKVWRIFRWQPELNDYAEYSSISENIVPGNAFWLINRDGKTFDVDNALSVSSFNNYSIVLQPGYNQIGDPYAFPVDWNSIINSDLILQLPVQWNPDIQDYELDQLSLEPWQGYWVYNQLNQVITLEVNPNGILGKKQSVNLFASLKSDEFLVNLKAIDNSGRSKDQMNYVGMMEDAKEGLDKYDVIKPPAINGRVKVLIHNNRNYLARDVVPVSKDGAYWDFSVETGNANEKVSLIVDKLSSLPEKFGIWLLDKDREIPVQISDGSAEIITRQDHNSNLRIIIGTEDFAKLNSENISLTPYDYALYQNYPNPFNPTTHITYQIKEKGKVTLQVFDILGRRIKTLVNGVAQSPGQHSAVWNGTNSSGEKVASGIYIYRIESNDFITSRKMILLK